MPRPNKNMGLPPIMPKTRSKDNLLQIRNNIRDLTNGQSGIQSVIEQGRKESKHLIVMDNLRKKSKLSVGSQSPPN